MTRPIKQAAAVVVGLAVLTGCSNGVEALTYQPRAAADWSDVAAGMLAVRHVYVVAPEPPGYQPGENAQVVLSAATRADQPDRLISATSPAATTVLVPEDLVVPVGGLMLDERITLLGLTEQLVSSEYVPLVLTFDSGLTIEVNAPVAVRDDPPEPNPDFEIPETDSNGDPLPIAEEGSLHGGGR